MVMAGTGEKALHLEQRDSDLVERGKRESGSGTYEPLSKEMQDSLSGADSPNAAFEHLGDADGSGDRALSAEKADNLQGIGHFKPGADQASFGDNLNLSCNGSGLRTTTKDKPRRNMEMAVSLFRALFALSTAVVAAIELVRSSLYPQRNN